MREASYEVMREVAMETIETGIGPSNPPLSSL